MKKLATKTLEKIKAVSSHARKKHLTAIFIFAALTTFAFGLLIPEKKLTSHNLSDNITPPTSNDIQWQTYQESVQAGEIPPVQKILEVTILYDRSSAHQVAVTSLDLKNGYPSRDEPPKAAYDAQLLGKNGEVLSQYTFNIETQRHTHFVNAEGNLDGDIITSPQATDVINLAWSDAAQKIRIRDKTGVVTTLSVENLAYTNNQPQLQTIQGDKLINKKQYINFNFVVPAYAASNKKLAITFVGDKFSDSKEFEENINERTAKLLSIEPFKSRASQIQFYRFNGDVDFQCTVESRSGRAKGSLRCNNARIKQFVNTKGAPTDYITLVSQKDFWATGGEIIYSSSIESSAPIAWVHEIGHQFGKLIEEYIHVAFQNKPGQIDNQVHWSGGDGNADTSPIGDGNCYAGTPPAKAWEGLAKKEDYREGCTYPNWYRSIDKSIMHDLETNCFSKPAQRGLNKQLDKLATPAKEVIADCPPLNENTQTNASKANSVEQGKDKVDKIGGEGTGNNINNGAGNTLKKTRQVVTNPTFQCIGPYESCNASTAASLNIKNGLRIEMGGGAYTDKNGNLWEPDSGLDGGNSIDRGDIPIVGTSDQKIYQTEHWTFDPTMTFKKQVPNGRYIVKLHFAETYKGTFGPKGEMWDEGIDGPGKRLFRIEIDGGEGASEANNTGGNTGGVNSGNTSTDADAATTPGAGTTPGADADAAMTPGAGTTPGANTTPNQPIKNTFLDVILNFLSLFGLKR